jgi:hypothetical protein
MTDEQRERVISRQQSRVKFEKEKEADIVIESTKPWYLMTAEEVVDHEEKRIKGHLFIHIL